MSNRDSEDIDLRCKSCGKHVGNLTVRVEDTSQGKLVIGSVRWVVGKFISCLNCFGKQQANRK